MKIYCFGNPLSEDDKIALDLIPALQNKFPKINFVEKDPQDGFPEKDIIILDVVKGIKKVTLIEDPKIITGKIYSPHDFDLGISLLLWKKMGKIESIKLIAIPFGKMVKEVENDAEKIIRKLLIS